MKLKNEFKKIKIKKNPEGQGKVKLPTDSDNPAPSVSGIRMLDGDVTDMVEARALSFRPHYVDVYLATWGPEDDGATLGGPGPLTLLALQNGVETVSDRERGSHFPVFV